MWAEIGEVQLIRPELVQETTEKISQIKDRLKAARDHHRRRKPLEFSVGPMAYQLDFLEDLNGVLDTFRLSNLKKCLADLTLKVPVDKIRVDAKLNLVEKLERKGQMKLKYPYLFSDIRRLNFKGFVGLNMSKGSRDKNISMTECVAQSSIVREKDVTLNASGDELNSPTDTFLTKATSPFSFGVSDMNVWLLRDQ
nr:hypothetical protein [Tanacetum cinerariifolium]